MICKQKIDSLKKTRKSIPWDSLKQSFYTRHEQRVADNSKEKAFDVAEGPGSTLTENEFMDVSTQMSEFEGKTELIENKMENVRQKGNSQEHIGREEG